MSKPRRWEIEATGVGDDVEMIERPKGNYVLYEDYARLKANDSIIVQAQANAGKSVVHYLAEIERLKAEVERLEKTEEYLQNTLNQYALDDMRLQAQVERLTKAGDALIKTLREDEGYDVGSFKEVRAWNAAKNGGQP